MPYFVYNLENGTNKINLIDTFDDPELVSIKINEAAINFIKTEHGEKRSENSFRDGIPDVNLTEEGYFLRHVQGSVDIDVYYRKIIISPGKFWGRYLDVTVNKMFTFGVTEFNQYKKKENLQNVNKSLIVSPRKEKTPFLKELEKKIAEREAAKEAAIVAAEREKLKDIIIEKTESIKLEILI